jgi:hypothetical protein
LSCCNGLLSSPLFEKKENLKRKPSLIRSTLLKLISSSGESECFDLIRNNFQKLTSFFRISKKMSFGRRLKKPSEN